MPVKSVPETSLTNGVEMTEAAYDLRPSQADSNESHGGATRVRRKLQKHPSNTRSLHDQHDMMNDSANTPPRAIHRRPSLKSVRGLARSPSKSTSGNRQCSPTRSSQPNAHVNTNVRPHKVGSSALFSSEEQDPMMNGQGYSTPFLPEVSFDDLAASINRDPDNYDLLTDPWRPPDLVSRSGSSDKKNLSGPASVTISSRYRADKFTGQPSQPSSLSKGSDKGLARTNSLAGAKNNMDHVKQGNTRDADATSRRNISPSMPRRLSQYGPPLPINPIAKTPRKSVGPAFFPASSPQQTLMSDASPWKPLKVTPTKSNYEAVASNSKLDPSIFPQPRNPYVSAEEANAIRQNRASRSKSMLQSKTMPDFLVSTRSSDFLGSLTSSSAQISGRDSKYIPTSAASRRLSTIPGHATGLGARTISPTDARRMKRLSVAHPAPPMPQTPPVLLHDIPYLAPRSTPDSPAIIPRKSLTPSSNRTTPDPQRKSFNSAVSISSNTSVNSAKLPSVIPRSSQNPMISKLPTLKGKTETISNAGDEVVPPVPAIPKAYESPKNEHDIPFFAPPKSNLPPDSESTNSNSTSEFQSADSSLSSLKEPPKAEVESRLSQHSRARRERQEAERASGAQDGRRTLQPLRLPPLNIQPLNQRPSERTGACESGPLAAGIMVTPPPKTAPLKAPSTPFTAPRAVFVTQNSVLDPAAPAPLQFRSTSSHHLFRPDTDAVQNAYSPSHARPIPETRASRKATSPFVSTSLPKTKNISGSVKVKSGDERASSTTKAEQKQARVNGPRAQVPDKSGKAQSPFPRVGSTGTETPSLGTTLRRKLSLTRKRSGSKAEVEQPAQSADRAAMPPPKLPASATWNVANPPNPNLANRNSPYLHQRRKSSHPEIQAWQETKASDAAFTERKTNQTLGLGQGSSTAYIAPRPLSSGFSSKGKLLPLNGHNVTPRIQAIDPHLDKDDLLAEEEMKKLASRRKTAETAAKELNELRRRAVAKDFISPTQALRSAQLNIFERGEIIDYKEIYFCGNELAKKYTGDLGGDKVNFGYDDERGDYNIVIGDHLAYRYEVVNVLGKGSFGQVVRCVDHKTGGLVAVKIIRNKKRFHQQALVEVDILQKLREWDPDNKYSMVNFTQSFYFRGHLCISTELLGMNLYEFIKLHDFKGFSLKLIRRFTKQLLNSLVLLKHHKVIHCDMKPENILLAHPVHTDIKVIDFGSSCLENEKVYTYIQSRFYRSPEVILGMSYGMPIDMWSLGCILAELLTGYPIFPGENEQEQLACIMEIFGPPDKHLIEKSSRRKLFFDSLGKPRLMVSSKGKRRRPSSKTLQQALKCDDEAFLDFLSRCLRWDPDRRIKPDEAINHEFITGIKTASIRNARPMPALPSNPPVIKRFNSIHATTNGTRTLSEAAAATARIETSVRTREGSAKLPSKTSTVKRHSTATAMNALPAPAKKSSSTTNTISNKNSPRIERVATNNQLHTAAAAAALTKPR